MSLAVLGGVSGCGTQPLPTHFDSHLSFDRTFNDALGAMADQKLIFSEQDRRRGRIVGELDGETIVATLQPMLDGALRVSFTAQGDSAAAAALRRKVTDSYIARTSNASILGGFKGGSGAGPIPCPSGPAFCP
jgi:hypothetical protein